MSYSFSVAGQDKKVVLIEAQPDEKVKLTPISLQSGRPLHRKRFETIDLAVEWLLANPYCLIELTLVSDTFIANSDSKRIYESHDGIIFIIPIILNENNQCLQTAKVNLDQNIQGLFADYFQSKYKQQPNNEILDLFNEIIASQSKNE